MSWRVIEADCVEAMCEMDEASIDAVVTDPPAGISFMGRGWDSDRSGGFVAWLASVMEEALRVTKPGAHALVWALPRTSHWTGSAIEAAGWEIRDRIAHHFGSGFPKSLNVGNGFGTALKPATEDWWLARKPLVGTVAQTVAGFGTGALNIDGCRIGTDEVLSISKADPFHGADGSQRTWNPTSSGAIEREQHSQGRWPANCVLSHLPECQNLELGRDQGEAWTNQGENTASSESAPSVDSEHGGEPSSGDTGSRSTTNRCAPGCPVAELDRQSGEQKSGTAYEPDGKPMERSIYGATGTLGRELGYGDTGGASRFFYVAKASRAERNAGLEGFEERKTRGNYGDGIQDARPHTPEGYVYEATTRNSHPTVKPVDLMRWLCRLVTPPGGTILDPFAGSGTTGIACVLEDLDFIGIEREADYCRIAEARIDYWAKQPKQLELA